MKQARPVQAKHAPLLGLFLNGYENMRQKMDAPCRRPLLEIAPLAFGKWHYTALAQETILSPANILELDLKKDAEDKTEYAYVMRTKPAEEQEDAEFVSEYSFALVAYSTESHPLVDDLRALVNYCTPDRATDENGLLLKEDKKAILDQLSLNTDFYLEYLMRLAWLHGLFVPMPSIHTQRVQPAEECESFFAQETADILFQLGETACTLASERFTWSMDLEEGIATPDFFYHMLESPREVDRIFVEFYKKVDVDIESIWQTPPENLNAEERSIVSSFLFTGIMLDKWFLTPMSVFFRFIRPIAFTPMRFYTLVNNLAALVLMEHNLGAELFTPPTYYSLTALGKELFADPDSKEIDKQIMPRTLPYEQLLEAVLQEAELRTQERMFLMEVVPDVLSIKVSHTSNDALWKIIEVGQDMDVNVLCKDLCAAFCMEEMADYMLSVPDQNGFPMEYSARGSKRSLNKANGKSLQELPIDTGSRLMLYPTHNKSMALTLDILEKGKGNPYLMYPRVTKQSPKIIEQEKIDEIF
ncbi:hypothetical protein [Anaerotignum sp.]|nr:hypothetical protein [Anaerotignum sp.]MBQ7758248.1 hypothetical protein [Anaerotignum sp.]